MTITSKPKSKKVKKKRKVTERDGKFYTPRGALLTRASHTKTEAEFWASILSALRRATKYWKPKLDKLYENRRPNESANKNLDWEYQCNHCKEWFAESKMDVDHIIPCGGINGLDKVCGWIERAFVEMDGFQKLCKPCHTIKTNAEKTKGKL